MSDNLDEQVAQYIRGWRDAIGGNTGRDSDAPDAYQRGYEEGQLAVEKTEDDIRERMKLETSETDWEENHDRCIHGTCDWRAMCGHGGTLHGCALDLCPFVSAREPIPTTSLHVGLHAKRCETNWREYVAAQVWRKHMSGLPQILGTGDEQREPAKLSDRDWQVVATMMQWLGSPCGTGFLSELRAAWQHAEEQRKEMKELKSLARGGKQR